MPIIDLYNKVAKESTSCKHCCDFMVGSAVRLAVLLPLLFICCIGMYAFFLVGYVLLCPQVLIQIPITLGFAFPRYAL